MNKVLNRLIAVLFCLTLSALLFFACRKTDGRETEENTPTSPVKFFSVKPGTDSAVAAIADAVRRQDQQRHFVDKLINRAGYPVWDKAIISEKNGYGKQIFIPFVNEKTKQTRAMLITMINKGDTAYRLLYNSRARSFGFDAKKDGNWNGKDVFHAFTVFDHEIFGHTKFTLNNGKYLNDTTGAAHDFKIQLTDNPNQQASREQGLYPVTRWVTFITCGLCAFRDATTETNSLDRCCNATYNTVPVTYWFNDETDETTYDLPTGYVEDGGGMLCPGCSWDDTNPCDVTPPYTEVCDGEWYPTLHVPTYNPLTYDSISVDHEMVDSNLTCLYNLLKNDFPAINQKAQLTMYSIFGVSMYSHLHFKINWSGNASSDYIMRTAPGRREWVNDDMNFYDTIEVNPYFATHATRETLIAAVIHESIHAYINWCFTSYQNSTNGVDSNYLKEHFPIHWEYVMNRPYSTQHDVMVSNYVNEIVNAIIAGGNQSSTVAMRTFVGQALAYSGLRETSVWKTLSDTCAYKAVGVWSENYQQPPYWSFTPPGCGSYPRSFRDSLHLSGICQ